MSIIGYSPWQDAASYGQALGQTLAQGMLQLPRQRAEMDMERQRFASQQGMVPLQQMLLRAQAGALQEKPGLLQSEIQKNLGMADYYRNAASWKGAQADVLENNPTKPNPTQDKFVLENIPDTHNGLPQNASPDAVSALMTAYQREGFPGMMKTLQSLVSVPNLQTNQAPNHAILGYKVPFSGTHPEVTTNSFTLRPGSGQTVAPINNVPPPPQRIVGQTLTPDGQFVWMGGGWAPVTPQ